jgi:hypothetical protein
MAPHLTTILMCWSYWPPNFPYAFSFTLLSCETRREEKDTGGRLKETVEAA